jgi:hypothetical protein
MNMVVVVAVVVSVYFLYSQITTSLIRMGMNRKLDNGRMKNRKKIYICDRQHKM